MSTTADVSIAPNQIDALLAEPTTADRMRWLQQADLWHEAGLAGLLEAGGQLVNVDLGQARQVLDLCIDLAATLAPDLRPRAIYLRAQTFAMDGDFDQALAQIAAARAGYQSTGQTAASLRTNVGLLHVLIHLGRHQEALATAADALDAAAQAGDSLPPETIALLTALLQQNRGICLKNMGQYAAAMDAYRVAGRHFDALDMEEDAATIRMNLGVILAELGHGTEAMAAYESAGAAFARAGNRLRQAQNLGEHGRVASLAGQLQPQPRRAGRGAPALCSPGRAHRVARSGAADGRRLSGAQFAARGCCCLSGCDCRSGSQRDALPFGMGSVGSGRHHAAVAAPG